MLLKRGDSIMGNKKHGKKKDNKKSKDSFAAIDSIGGVITGAPSAVIGAIGTAAHTAVDAVGDVGEGTGKAVADTAKNTVGTAQAALETIQPGHLFIGKDKKHKKDKKKHKKK
jgi:hypothetical protein